MDGRHSPVVIRFSDSLTCSLNQWCAGNRFEALESDRMEVYRKE
jgi:hypothetical protein